MTSNYNYGTFVANSFLTFKFIIFVEAANMKNQPFNKLQQYDCLFCYKCFDSKSSLELHIEHRHSLSATFFIELSLDADSDSENAKQTVKKTNTKQKQRLSFKNECKRRKCNFWTENEDDCLRRGICKYQQKHPIHAGKKGVKGIWSAIRFDPQFAEQLKNRSPKQLYDRYRIWLKNDDCVYVKNRLIFKLVPKQ